ncbi:WXG100 family type VII secretion target [Microbacterium sp. NPDC089189]|uniref:WXG100 family type VII secretion target n=1 Tax=Microbacterium sp. NPDC089189 TaxID=3154972 RepID=UPI00342B5D27
MSDRITIDFDRVAQSVLAVQQSAQAIHEVLEQLDAELARLDSAWKGEAYIAYVGMRAHWEANMRATQRRLSAYAAVMEQAGGAIAEQERTVARSF